MVARGEIWWHEAPDERRRPYLVLTRDEGLALLNQVLAAPATRIIRDIPTEVGLDASDGMPVECVLSLDNLRVVRKAHLTEHLTTLSADRLRAVCDAVAFATACR